LINLLLWDPDFVIPEHLMETERTLFIEGLLSLMFEEFKFFPNQSLKFVSIPFGLSIISIWQNDTMIDK
jgi:hypothetical protein